jgi:hypothetical protein
MYEEKEDFFPDSALIKELTGTKGFGFFLNCCFLYFCSIQLIKTIINEEKGNFIDFYCDQTLILTL